MLRRLIAGTEHSEVATTFREGAFRYRIPLADGAYRVSLTLMEPKAKPGERKFDVLAGGKSRCEISMSRRLPARR